MVFFLWMAKADYGNNPDNRLPIPQIHEESLRGQNVEDPVIVDPAEAAETAVRVVPQGDESDPQVISKAEVHVSEPKCNDKPIRPLRAKSKRVSNIQKGKEAKEKLLLGTGAAKKSGTDACTALKATQWDLHECEKELRKVRKQKDAAEHKTQELRKNLKDSQRELKVSQTATSQRNQSLQEVQEHVNALQTELSACKDDLFRLQPAPPLTDSEILRKFESISQQIVNWIGAEVFAFEKAYPNGAKQIFSVEKDREAMIFLNAHPAAGEHLARFMIHRFLQVHIFSEDIYLFGLPEGTQSMLRKIEESMAGLDPPRDPLIIAMWRSETLQALAAITEQVYLKQRQASYINDRLFDELGEVFPFLFHQQKKTTFFQKVTLPAANLAVAIRGSTTTYSFVPPEGPNEKLKAAQKQDLKEYRLVDIKTAKHLKPSSMVVADGDGGIGDAIMIFEPALFRIDRDGKETVLLPQMILVELSHPLGKRKRT